MAPSRSVKEKFRTVGSAGRVSSLSWTSVSAMFPEEGTDENLEEAKRLLRDAEAEYVNLVGSEDMNTIIEYIAGYPTTFFVNSEGKIIGAAFVGGQSEETFKKAIEALLK